MAQEELAALIIAQGDLGILSSARHARAILASPLMGEVRRVLERMAAAGEWPSLSRDAAALLARLQP